MSILFSNTNTELLKGYLKKELEIERDKHLATIFDKTLEQIFIEKRLYKKIEELTSYEEIHNTIKKSLKPYHKKLSRIPEEADRERLLNIPIRRISRFNIQKNQDDIQVCEDRIEVILKELKKYQALYNSLSKVLNKKI